jgi:hypothetical protein
MIILFTGHRDKACNIIELKNIVTEFPSATWIHGGARGFDSQVHDVAQVNGVTTEVYPPDYTKHGAAAPLVRNRAMVDRCDRVFALYDGRAKGGTYYTIEYAKRKGKAVTLLCVL